MFECRYRDILRSERVLGETFLSSTASTSLTKLGNVTYQILSSAWGKLWPGCVSGCAFQGSDAQAVGEIVFAIKNIALDIDGGDVEEILEDDNNQLIMNKLAELQSEQWKVLVRSTSLRKRKTGRGLAIL